MEDKFYCECCCDWIANRYINTHSKFCEFIQQLAERDVDNLLKELGINDA